MINCLSEGVITKRKEKDRLVNIKKLKMYQIRAQNAELRHNIKSNKPDDLAE